MRSMSIPDMTVQLMGCVKIMSPHLLDLGLGVHHEGTVLHIEKGKVSIPDAHHMQTEQSTSESQ